LPKLRDLLENTLPKNLMIEGYRVEQDFPAIGYRKLVLNARRIIGKPGNNPMILLAMEELT
jgi:hypothetical protein